jgi:hypothetical protein
MRGAGFWQVLGIAPTDSEAAVRAAYARKLKTTNPEDDAEGFKQLRAAYEAALWEARWRMRSRQGAELRPGQPEQSGADDEDFLDEEEYFDEDMLDEPYVGADGRDGEPARPFSPSRPPRPVIALDRPDPELEAHRQACARLEALVYDRAPANEVIKAYEAVRASPAMGALQIYANTETWLISVLHHGRPGSEVLIDRAIADFGWEKAALRFKDGAPAASVLRLRTVVAQDRETAALRERLRDKRHEFHPAYREITRPFAERNWFSRQKGMLRAGLMERFLNHVAAKNPSIEAYFDQDALLWWRRVFSRAKSPLWFWHFLVRGGVVVAIFAAMIAFAPPPADTPAGQQPVQDVRGAMRELCMSTTLARSARSAAGAPCERMVALAPDSLLMRQYAGVAALRAVNLPAAQAHFDAILAVAPADSYALYGAGLARWLSRSSEDRPLGVEMMAQAIAANPGVRSYYDGLGAPWSYAELPAVEARPFPARERPSFDTRPRTATPFGQADVEAAMQHFGMRGPLPAGRVVLECLALMQGDLAECVIVSETPANLGLGEVALRASQAVRVEPALLANQPVNRVPVLVPVSFEAGAPPP